jgi:glycosyltransferase involved in cell wall biosynthesis
VDLPRLSVIVPNYNHAQHLPRSLGALLRQSVAPDEIIVIDDASTDNSLEVLTNLAREHPQLRIHRNTQNQGVVCNMNRGIDLAKNDFLFFAAADDEIQPGLFEKSLRLLAAHPQAALSCTVSRWHDVASGMSWHMAAGMADAAGYLSPEDLVRVGRAGKLIICTSSAILRKEPLLRVGRFLPELRWHCDWFAVMIPAFRHGLCFVPEPLSDFYLHPNSYYNRGRRGAEHLAVLNGLLDRLGSPAFADVAPRLRDSNAFAVFGLPMLRLLRQRPACRQFLTPSLLLAATRRSGELLGKKLLPRPVAKLCLKLLYSSRR